MSRIAVRPFLIAKDEEGVFRVTTRTTRFNSQGYPLVTTQKLSDSFPSLATARAFVRQEFGAEAKDISLK